MNRHEQDNYFEDFIDNMRKVMKSKSIDYADQEDVLSNFKQASMIAHITPEVGCVHELAKKVSRLGNIIAKGEVNNEDIHDSLIDLANYSILLSMIAYENR